MITFRKRCENCIFWKSPAKINAASVPKGFGICQRHDDGRSEMQWIASNEPATHVTIYNFHCADFMRK